MFIFINRKIEHGTLVGKEGTHYHTLVGKKIEHDTLIKKSGACTWSACTNIMFW